ncbi:unnamed protein product [Rotaria socialis]|uniref:HAT C-terminal dimerisation domain-containing protein n=1 Tax=Rotaria socialis TaxID=392032 RepID=A0A820RD93_9BILA|nr:unnamed protein product [Rotaria socialis]
MSTNSEPVKKKHRTIEYQFLDPVDDNETFVSTGTTTNQTDEIIRYLKMSVNDQFKISNPLIAWEHHQNKLPYLSKLARRMYSIPATPAYVERHCSLVGPGRVRLKFNWAERAYKTYDPLWAGLGDEKVARFRGLCTT